MNKDQQIHDIVLAYTAATDAHKVKLDNLGRFKVLTPEEYTKKYLDYFKLVSSALDTTI